MQYNFLTKNTKKAYFKLSVEKIYCYYNGFSESAQCSSSLLYLMSLHTDLFQDSYLEKNNKILLNFCYEKWLKNFQAKTLHNSGIFLHTGWFQMAVDIFDHMLVKQKCEPATTCNNLQQPAIICSNLKEPWSIILNLYDPQNTVVLLNFVFLKIGSIDLCEKGSNGSTWYLFWPKKAWITFCCASTT